MHVTVSESDPNEVDFVQLVVTKIFSAGLICDAPNTKRSGEHLDDDGKRMRVINFKQPSELEEIFHGMDISTAKADRKTINDIVDNVIEYSVKTQSKFFLNQLYHGVDSYALAGSWLSDALNTSGYTYEVAPVFTLAESAVIKFATKLFYGPDSGGQVDGLTVPGGSMANMFAMVLARHRTCPDLKKSGLGVQDKQLVAFTSAQAHYSIIKAVNWLGIGTDNLVVVPTDGHGRMSIDHLRKSIHNCHRAGKRPFFVNATAGTTVLGAFDDIDGIADLLESLDDTDPIWLHVDACWGGTLALSAKHRCHLAGVQRADSISWNPHKMLSAPLQTSIFLCKHKQLLYDCNSTRAAYLFQTDKAYDVSYDFGDKSIQCGRKVDAFKLWLMLKARGLDCHSDLVDQAMDNVRLFHGLIDNHPRFRLVLTDPDVGNMNVCFFYLPDRLCSSPFVNFLSIDSRRLCNGDADDVDDTDEKAKFMQDLDMIAPRLKTRLMMAGSLMISYQRIPEYDVVNCFRMIIHCQPRMSPDDVKFVVDEIDRLGHDL